MTNHPNRSPADRGAVSRMVMVGLGGLVLAVGLVTAGALWVLAPGAPSAKVQSAMSVPGARVQEDIGNRILAVERFDSERLTQLARRWSDVSDNALSFAEGRKARLQEALGRSIATTAQLLYQERSSLDTALADRRATVRSILSNGWFQERVGAAIVQTAAEVPPHDPRFLPRLEARITMLSAMESRVANQAALDIGTLSARRAQLPREESARLADAVADAHRVTRFDDASVNLQVTRVVGAIQNEMPQPRSAWDYQQLANAAQAAARSPWNRRGFLEFGAAALLGAIAMMVWVGLSTQADFPRGRAWGIRERRSLERRIATVH